LARKMMFGWARKNVLAEELAVRSVRKIKHVIRPPPRAAPDHHIDRPALVRTPRRFARGVLFAGEDSNISKATTRKRRQRGQMRLEQLRRVYLVPPSGGEYFQISGKPPKGARRREAARNKARTLNMATLTVSCTSAPIAVMKPSRLISWRAGLTSIIVFSTFWLPPGEQRQ